MTSPHASDHPKSRPLDLHDLAGVAGGSTEEDFHGIYHGDTDNDVIVCAELKNGSSNDWVNGAQGDDIIFGNQGYDTLLGGDGSDYLDGGADDDLLHGGAGVDILIGGDGNDTLIGGHDNDILIGGDGSDIFKFDASDNPGNDIITDFNANEDKIRILNADSIVFDSTKSTVSYTYQNETYTIVVPGATADAIVTDNGITVKVV